MEGTFSNFCEKMADMNRKNLMSSCYSCCYLSEDNVNKHMDSNACEVCSEIGLFIKQNSTTGFAVNEEIIIDRIPYIIVKCKGKIDALRRFFLSQHSNFFVRVLFAFSCSNNSYILQRSMKLADSVNKVGTDIRKFLAAEGSKFICTSLRPVHIRVGHKGAYFIDTEPYASYYEENVSGKKSFDEKPFVSLLFNYINENIDNVDIVGIYYNKISIINEIKAQAKLYGKVSRTANEYMELLENNTSIMYQSSIPFPVHSRYINRSNVTDIMKNISSCGQSDDMEELRFTHLVKFYGSSGSLDRFVLFYFFLQKFRPEEKPIKYSMIFVISLLENLHYTQVHQILSNDLLYMYEAEEVYMKYKCIDLINGLCEYLHKQDTPNPQYIEIAVKMYITFLYNNMEYKLAYSVLNNVNKLISMLKPVLMYQIVMNIMNTCITVASKSRFKMCNTATLTRYIMSTILSINHEYVLAIDKDNIAYQHPYGRDLLSFSRFAIDYNAIKRK